MATVRRLSVRSIVGAIALLAGLTATPARPSPGALDPRFGEHGVSDACVQIENNDGCPWSRSIAVLPDGKLAITGWSSAGGWAARFRANGSLDSSFANGLIAVGVDPATSAADGRGGLIVAGDGMSRLDRAGNVDRSFGGNGLVYPHFGHDTLGYVVATGVLPDRQVLVAQSISTISRYSPDGELDTTFGNDGTTSASDATGEVAALVVRPDGGFYAIGYGKNAADGGGDSVVARYTPGGELDKTFGSGAGYVHFRFGGGVCRPACGTSYSSGAMAGTLVRVGGKERLVVAGGSGRQELDFGVARLTDAGTLDPNFGVRGSAITGFGTESTGAEDVVASSGGDVIAGGLAEGNIVLARFSSQGTIVRGWGAAGRACHLYADGLEEATWGGMTRQPGAGPVVTASGFMLGGTDLTLLVRFRRNFRRPLDCYEAVSIGHHRAVLHGVLASSARIGLEFRGRRRKVRAKVDFGRHPRGAFRIAFGTLRHGKELSSGAGPVDIVLRSASGRIVLRRQLSDYGLSRAPQTFDGTEQ